MNDILVEKLQKLPNKPGCYLMKDSAGEIIYVGKAVNLKNRVRSYFHSPGSHDGKTNLLVEHIVDFDTIVVNSEADALILEANLIKEHSPYYNILMRDDKYYPYLCLTMTEQFPRLIVARRAKNDGNKYFGPYPDVTGMRQVLKLLEGIFPLRSCGFRTWPVGHRPCLNAHIGRCLAPCGGKISREEYLIMVGELAQFLLGKAKGLLNKMERQMKQASEELRFEDAARYRDAAEMIRQVQTRQQLDLSADGDNYDMAAIAIGGGQAVAELFFTRGGKVVGREHFFFTNGEDADKSLLMRCFLQDYYGGGQMIPAIIYVDIMPEDENLLSKLFSQDCGHKVTIHVPQRGDKKRLLGLVQQNAELILSDYLHSRHKQQEQNAAALEELRQLLQLQRLPNRIECYDISHIQGTNMVGSMVVFVNGVAMPKNYRRF
ncbi:MAG: excinuclease ABC subunit UvrC, partial [Clostridiales bacterium]